MVLASFLVLAPVELVGGEILQDLQLILFKRVVLEGAIPVVDQTVAIRVVLHNALQQCLLVWVVLRDQLLRSANGNRVATGM